MSEVRKQGNVDALRQMLRYRYSFNENIEKTFPLPKNPSPNHVIQFAPGFSMGLKTPVVTESPQELFKKHLRDKEDPGEGCIDLEIFDAMRNNAVIFSTIPCEPPINLNGGDLMLLEYDELKKIGIKYRIFTPFNKERLVSEILAKQEIYVAKLTAKKEETPVEEPTPELQPAGELNLHTAETK